ncbi:HSP90 family molecular chaperone [Bradyrhizobium sp. USDA 3240]
MFRHSIERLKSNPRLEAATARGIEVLLLSDPVDAFWTSMPSEFEGKPLKSLSQGDLNLDLIPRVDEADEAKKDEPAADEAATIAVIKAAREIVAEFHGMIRRRAAAELSSWIERARASLVASFARGVTNDEAAVRAAITSPWSNGQTEGQITRLKLVRRQMYGRGKIDLLQARLIGAE